MILNYNELHALIVDKLKKHGCDATNAEAVADFMARADADGCRSHGIFRLPAYVASLVSGKVNGAAKPSVEVVAPSALRCDGDGGFAPTALWKALPELESLAKSQGIACLSLVDIYHFSSLWIETGYLAERGLVSFAFTSSKPFIAPAGGREAFFGTNPMAFAWPRSSGEPLAFDQASAMVARGDVMIAAKEGHELPEGCGLDRDGNATRDAGAILDGGVQLPFGGYKGSNIALMVELLAGALVGESFSFETALRDNGDGGPSRGGEFIMAIDVGRFSGGDVGGRTEVLLAEMLKQDGVRLPSQRRYRNRVELARSGIEVDDGIYEKAVSL